MSGDNNKLIVEFMGISIDGEFAYIEDEGSPLEEVIPINKLNYHTSWDWLMPVIHKILQDNDGIKFFNFSANISHALFNNNINNAYKAVVEFIKEYNQNN